MDVEPFEIAVPDATLADLRERLARTRWPDPAPAAPWEQGTDLDWMRDLAAYWADGFDWRAQERRLNGLDQFRTEIDGVRIHFVHARAAGGDGIPLVLTHGWPSAFVEYLDVLPLLTDPTAHGIDGPAFDVVLPSLPGYTFSSRPRAGVTARGVARLWRQLMRGLGYERYGAGGGDWGAGVATFLGMDFPDELLGVHLTNVEIAPYIDEAKQPRSDAERAYEAQVERWDAVERGYSSIQSTKPQTVGYGLTDSPVALAAWLLEKWRSWTDSKGDLDATFGRDFLLTLVTLYWATGAITTTLRDYYDNYGSDEVAIGPDDFVSVPTGFARFAHMLRPEGEVPREYMERLYAVRRFTVMPRGGHFASAEEPDLVARDIAAFFGSL